jgi:hypothetical protein
MDCRPNTFLLNDHCRKNFSRVATSSTDGHPLDEEERSKGQSALSECRARVRRLSEVRVVSGYTARSGAGSETVFRWPVIVWATALSRNVVPILIDLQLELRRDDNVGHSFFHDTRAFQHVAVPELITIIDLGFDKTSAFFKERVPFAL